MQQIIPGLRFKTDLRKEIPQLIQTELNQDHFKLAKNALYFINSKNTEIDFNTEFKYNDLRQHGAVILFGHNFYSKASFFDTERGKEIWLTESEIKYMDLEKLIINSAPSFMFPSYKYTTLYVPLFQDEEELIEDLFQKIPEKNTYFKSIVSAQKLALPNRQQVYMKYFK